MKEEQELISSAPRTLSVERAAVARLPTEVGEFKIAGYRSLVSDEEFVALFKGEMRPDVPTLVRIHSQCLTGDVFGSTKCDCRRQLRYAMEMIEQEGRGAIVYQLQEGRGIGIINKRMRVTRTPTGTVASKSANSRDHEKLLRPTSLCAALSVSA